MTHTFCISSYSALPAKTCMLRYCSIASRKFIRILFRGHALNYDLVLLGTIAQRNATNYKSNAIPVDDLPQFQLINNTNKQLILTQFDVWLSIDVK